MKLWGKFFLAILTLSLLSYGISGAAFAAIEPLSVTTNKEFYTEGATITISGLVKDFDISDDMRSIDVSNLVLSPNGNIVTIAQVTPSSDGNYSTTILKLSLICLCAPLCFNSIIAFNVNHTTSNHSSRIISIRAR